jgi:muramidase (phage lysozyme)
MLPALAGFAVKALLPSEKKVDKDKLLNRKESSAIQKVDDEKGIIKAPKIQKKTISTNLFLPQPEIKALPPAAEVKRDVKDGRLDDIFDRVGETLQGIIDVLKNQNQTQKQEQENKKEEAKVDEKKEREEKLEKDARKKPFKMPNIKAPEDKFNLMRFFGNVLLGSLALAIFNNLEQIIDTLKNVFKTIKNFITKIGEFFSPIWNGMKWITNEGTKLVAKLLGIPAENLDSKDLKKNLQQIIDKIPFLKNLFNGINSTIESLRSGRGLTPEQQPAGGGGGGEQPIGGSTPGQWGPVLDAIKSAEMGRGGYESMYPSTTLPGATNMTLQEVASRATGAVGAYQFLDPVGQGRLAGLKPTDKFSPANQDKMAVALITKKRGVTLDMVKNNPDEAMIRLGMEWAGLPMPKQMQGAKRVVQAGQSYYAGDGRNKAHVSVKQMRSVLAKMGAPSVQQQSQRAADTTAQQAATQATAQTQAPPAPVLPSPEQAAAQTQAPTAPALPSPAQAQVAPTQAPPAVSASVPQIMQQAEYEVPGGSQSTVIPIPISGGSAPMVMSGGGTKLFPIGVSKQALLNSYYQAQLTGFLYKQG